MNRKLIYENKKGIENELSYASMVEINLNKALDLFHSMQSFAKIEDEEQAFMFAENPTEFFDKMLIKAASFKPIGKSELNPQSIATMFGVDRIGFFNACRSKQPQSQSSIPIRMSIRDKKLVIYVDGKFKIKDTELSKRLELHRIYAENETELQMLEYWENLAKILNTHIEKGFVNRFEIFKTARALGLTDDGKLFTANYPELARTIKKAS